MTSRKNAFDFLRLLLALSVVVSHGILIGGYKYLDPLSLFSKNQTNLAEFGVMGFFTLSGYLITSSFERSRNVIVFLCHRVLRILPGFWVCLLVTAFLLAPLIFFAREQSLKNWSFTGEQSSITFLFRNFLLAIHQWGIKDVLINSAYDKSLNGSLWTLLPEFLCYCLTLLAGIFGLFRNNKALVAILTVVTFIFFAINTSFSKNYGPTILILSPALKLYASYLAGTLMYVFRDHLLLDKRGTIFLFFFIVLLLKFGGYNLISPLLIAMTLINVFQHFEVNMKYDLSYGIYIYSFPIQQLTYQIFHNNLHIALFISISIVVTLVFSFLSFHLIEKPALSYKKKLNKLFEPAEHPKSRKIAGLVTKYL